MEFKIEKITNAVSEVGSKIKKYPLLIGAVGVVGLVGFLALKKGSGTTQTVAVDDKIATFAGTPEAVTADNTLDQVTDLLDQYKTDIDLSFENSNQSLYKYQNLVNDELQKIQDTVKTNSDLTSTKLQLIQSNQQPVTSISSPSTTATTPVAPSTVKEIAVSNYQQTTPDYGNNGVGYNKVVSDAFEANLKVNKTAYDTEIARVNKVIADRKSAGLDITAQTAYLNKIK